MADGAAPPQTGTCVHCRLEVSREDDDALWKTAAGKWRCAFHPNAGRSRVTPHKVS